MNKPPNKTMDQWRMAAKVLPLLALIAFILTVLNPAVHLLVVAFYTIVVICIVVQLISIVMQIRAIRYSQKEQRND